MLFETFDTLAIDSNAKADEDEPGARLALLSGGVISRLYPMHA